MIKYKLVETANGRTQYWKNGKMVKKAEIPADILPRLQAGVELQMPSSANDTSESFDETVDQEDQHEAQSSQKELPTDCLFCGEPATRKRFVNQRIANLCEDDYSSHTTGEIAEQIRKFDESEQTSQE